MVVASQALRDITRVLTSQNSVVLHDHRFLLLIGQSTGAGSQCVYLGSQSEVTFTPRGRNIPPEGKWREARQKVLDMGGSKVGLTSNYAVNSSLSVV